ncbi:MAG: SGNH/GDSL hydrolase family protein [Mangrovibacterium sp.]
MNRFIWTILLALIGLSACQTQISILGDSYSTFGGHVLPDTNYVWYGIPDKKAQNDVTKVEEMWWHPIVNREGYRLEQNNSFSGSTICNTGYRGEDYSNRSFITRLTKLGNPDIILVFGGTNDSWAKAPIGEFKYNNWTIEELYTFRPAFAFMLFALKNKYPKAKIYNITNSELSNEVSESMNEICNYYEISNILLEDIDKQAGHPSVSGMKSIAQQVLDRMQ